MSDEHSHSRRDFYELLWQEPMKKIAARFIAHNRMAQVIKNLAQY